MYSFALLSGLNLTLALGGLFLTVVTIILFIDYLRWGGSKCLVKLAPYLWPIAILTTLGSVVISLIYSEYFGFIPCSLCWLQRIAIYPQALMVLLAFRQNDARYFPLYGIGLSLFGLVVALYQYVYQMLPHEATGGILPCLADGSNADCAVKVINEFGFVTFPYLSAITFAFLIVIYLYLRKQSRI